MKPEDFDLGKTKDGLMKIFIWVKVFVGTT